MNIFYDKQTERSGKNNCEKKGKWRCGIMFFSSVLSDTFKRLISYEKVEDVTF